MRADLLIPLRFLARFFMLILLLVFGTIPVLLCVNRIGASIRIDDRNLDEFVLNWWPGRVCRAFGVKLKVIGQVQDGPVLIVANHISWLDILALHSAATTAFVSKAEVRDWPIVNLITKLSPTVFHERGSHDSSSKVIQAMAANLKQGGRVAIFPEGGIKSGDGVKVFHARLFAAAIEARCAIQPVMIRYTRNGRRDPGVTFGENEKFMGNILRLLGRPSSVCEVRFLQPVQAEGQPRKELAGLAQTAITREFEAEI